MAREALANRLKEIKMSNYDATMYEDYLQAVKTQIDQVRVILEGMESKNRDNRVWTKNQTSGDLDESKLVEGITGETNIYKRRSEQTKLTPGEIKIPKRIRFVMDISASMYRFNGYDRRLERMLQTAVMIMESFEGFSSRIKYDMVGHSGFSAEIALITVDKIPSDRKERLQILNTMIAHSQYCPTGDFTLEATTLAIEHISKQEADEHFVFVLSDANFDRYAINPAIFGKTLVSNKKVQAYVIFIASLWKGQAERIMAQLPSGHGKICMDTSHLPQIFHQLLTQNVLQ
eukprot:TRINITY_DN3708_c0_g2_i1.p1 TRINITY_DN3708_c0_g2~~TRINITY_DN3708_c0_g2_i1.p1  ORF type:complete len:289 (-),score=42.41 TRINITY_DN3708_c0_g2_i1:22-888(-)